MILARLISVLWVMFAVVWLIGRLHVKRAQERAPISARLLYGIPVVFGTFLLINDRIPLAWLETRILPRSSPLDIFAVCLTAAGIGFAVWARFYLGQNWSSAVTIKVGHELIRSGPYAWVRHPIYSGILVGVFGTALAAGRPAAFIAMVFFFLGFWVKSRMEEQFMRKMFGEQYVEYSSTTGALIPKFRI